MIEVEPVSAQQASSSSSSVAGPAALEPVQASDVMEVDPQQASSSTSLAEPMPAETAPAPDVEMAAPTPSGYEKDAEGDVLI